MNPTIVNGTHLGVRVGEKELVVSGVVHLDTPDVLVEFDDLVIEFKFKDDDGVSRYESNAEGEKKLVIILFNHKSALGEGVFKPIEIGTKENKTLFLTYFVSTVNKEEEKRRFEFALYYGTQR